MSAHLEHTRLHHITQDAIYNVHCVRSSDGVLISLQVCISSKYSRFRNECNAVFYTGWEKDILHRVKTSSDKRLLRHARFFKNQNFIGTDTAFSIRSPFVTLLSQRAQSGRWSSHRQTGVVHQITSSFGDFILFFTYVLYAQFILVIINGALYPVKQLDHF
jgi:hypothetical protein